MFLSSVNYLMGIIDTIHSWHQVQLLLEKAVYFYRIGKCLTYEINVLFPASNRNFRFATNLYWKSSEVHT